MTSTKKVIEQDNGNKLLRFVQYSDGTVVDGNRVEEYRRASRAMWHEFLRLDLAPATWGQATAGVNDAYVHEMETKFPELALCSAHWKAHKVATLSYSDWHDTWVRRKQSGDAPVASRSTSKTPTQGKGGSRGTLLATTTACFTAESEVPERGQGEGEEMDVDKDREEAIEEPSQEEAQMSEVPVSSCSTTRQYKAQATNSQHCILDSRCSVSQVSSSSKSELTLRCFRMGLFQNDPVIAAAGVFHRLSTSTQGIIIAST